MSEAKPRRKRRILRVPVSFWKLGHPDTSYVGFTTDVSATGVFIASNSPLPTQTEVGIMVDSPAEQFVVSGVVARAIKVHPSLQRARVAKSGMGILFHDEENPAVTRLNEMGHATSLVMGAAGLPA